METRNNGCRKSRLPFECFSGTVIIILFRKIHYLFRNFWSVLPIVSFVELVISAMATKIKGLYKSFKYISQIFVVKEREMEIGYPTDVKHVAHIGWDGPSGNGPNWMNEFKTAPDFSTSLGNLGDRRDPNPLSTTIMPARDLAESSQPTSNLSKDIISLELPTVPKKPKRKKAKSTPSATTSRQVRATKPKATYNEIEREAPLPIVQV